MSSVLYVGQKKQLKERSVKFIKNRVKTGRVLVSRGFKKIKKFKNLPLQVPPQTLCIVMDVSNILDNVINTVTYNYVHSLIMN